MCQRIGLDAGEVGVEVRRMRAERERRKRGANGPLTLTAEERAGVRRMGMNAEKVEAQMEKDRQQRRTARL